MTTLTTDMRLFWPSTNGSIPDGFTRDTDYDDVFFQSVTGDIIDSIFGGTHTHEQSHNHTFPFGHTHQVSSGAGIGTTIGAVGGPAGFSATQDIHQHGATTSTSVIPDVIINTSTSSADAATPPFFKVIVIKPDDGNQQIPDGVLILADSDIGDDDFKIVDGVDSNITINEEFLEGAVGGGDGGGTGGSATHTHGLDAHTHGIAHIHTATSGGYLGGSITNSSFTVPVFPQVSQAHHTVTLLTTLLQTDGADINSAAASSLPAFTDFAGYENTNGSQVDIPSGAIIGYAGTRASLTDDNWSFVKINDQLLRVVNTTGAIGDTGGSNSHAHSSGGSHNHAVTGTHNHTTSVFNGPQLNNTQTGRGGPNLAKTTHTHLWNIAGGSTGNTSSNTFALDSKEGRDKWRGMLFVKFAKSTVKVKGAKVKGATIL